MSLHLIDHPLAKILITQLRDKDTKAESFRNASRRITQLLMIEATRGLATESCTVTTPMEETEGDLWAHDITIVPIIRAGIAMAGPALDFFPNATVGYIGLERNESTALANNYYCKLASVKGRKIYVVDPMLATGGSTMQAIEMCRQAGAEDITVVTIISSPEGVEAVLKTNPDITIFTASLDRKLDERKYILPGLGDFGDRLYNT